MATQTVKLGRKTWRLVALGAVAVLGTLMVLPYVGPDKRPARFIEKESRKLRAYNNLNEVRPVADYTRTFPDGSWVVARSVCSCTGAGFNATVFYDSTGAVRADVSHHFCGGEGLQSELKQVAGGSMEAFYAGLQQCQLTNVP